MSRIGEIRDRLSGLLKDVARRSLPFPSVWPVNDWISFAKEYLEAAELIHTYAPTRTRTRMQVSGQAIESALKAFLTATKRATPTSHDLIELCEQAEADGLLVTDLEAGAIFQVSLHFFRDIGSGTKFKARYPPATLEINRLPVPFHHAVAEVVESICCQALSKAENK